MVETRRVDDVGKVKDAPPPPMRPTLAQERAEEQAKREANKEKTPKMDKLEENVVRVSKRKGSPKKKVRLFISEDGMSGHGMDYGYL